MATTASRQNRVIDDVTSVKDDIKAAAAWVKSDMGEAAENVRDDLQDLANRTGRHARELAESTEEALNVYMRENPIKTTAIAAGVGLVIGALFFRR